MTFTEGKNEPQKRGSASEKLKRASTSLKRKFQRALQTDIPTPEGTPAKRRKAADDDELAR